MAYDSKEKQLNLLLNEATDTENTNLRTDLISSFCNLVNSYNDGCRFATILLSKKLNSEEEWELLQTLNVLKNCVEKCGEPFHREIGMFRFLNNMIKLISPKYLGHLTTNKVKEEICALIKEWSASLKEPKIKEAYHMLKQQNLIPETVLKENSISSDQESLAKSKASSSISMDEKMSKRLSKLLKSKCPDDLNEANQLIKSLVKEDELKIEKMVARNSELDFITSNVQLLTEMMAASPGTLGTQEKELMDELYNTCKDKKDRLLTMAEETNENDELLNEIIRVHEEMTKCIGEYKLLSLAGKSTRPSAMKGGHYGESLLDDQSLKVSSDSELAFFDNKKIWVSHDLKVDELRDVFTSISNPAFHLKPKTELQGSPMTYAQSDLVRQDRQASKATIINPSMHSLLDDSTFLDITHESACTSPNILPSSNFSYQNLIADLMEPSAPSSTLEDKYIKNGGTNEIDQFLDFLPTVQKQPKNVIGGLGDNKMTQATKGFPNKQPSKSSLAFKELDELAQLAITKSLTEIKSSPLTLDALADAGVNAHDEGCCLENSLEVGSKSNTTLEVELGDSTLVKTRDLIPGDGAGEMIDQLAVCEVFKRVHIPLKELLPDTSASSSTIYDEHNLKILMCKTQNIPVPGSKIFTLTLINTNTSSLTDISLKVQSVEPCLSKIEPEKISQITAFNPLLPPPFHILVLYVYNHKDAWNLQTRFLLRYTLKAELIESSVIINNIYECY